MTPFRQTSLFAACALVFLSTPMAGSAQQSASTPNARHPGSAVVTVDQNEYLIRIECRVPSQPEMGFTTEPNRVTRRETGGQYNMVGLRLRPWQDTEDVIVSLEGWVVWMPKPSSSGGVLDLTLDMSASGTERDGQPVLMTYDRWQDGERWDVKQGIRFRADCNTRDPEAPAFRTIPN